MKDVLMNEALRDSVADDEGGNTSWQRAESVPSSDDRDPKQHEERRSELSFRRGPYGRWRPVTSPRFE